MPSPVAAKDVFLRSPTPVFDPDAHQGSEGAEPDPIGSGRAGLVEEVTHVLRQRIYGGIYRPGELLRQVQLSEELNVSRTPLREALRLLQSEGLVEAWLFQNDGRFALKTLAKPQRSA